MMIQFIVFLILFAPYAMPSPGKEMPADFQPFPESRFLSIGGIDVHYRLLEPQVPVKGNVMLVHGFSGSTFSWRYTIPYLHENGYRVLAVDLPAYGFSDKKNDFNHSSSSRAELLWKLAGQYAETNWVLIGHSMGAGTVIAMAVSNPDATRQLVLVDGGFFPSADRRQGILINLLRFPPLQRWADQIASRRYIGFDRFQGLLSSAYGQKADSLAVQGYLEPFLYKGSARAVIKSFLNSREIFLVNPHEIESRTLIIWGDRDTWVPVSAGQNIHGKIRNSQLVLIENSGHCPMETHPILFHSILLEFLSAGKN